MDMSKEGLQFLSKQAVEAHTAVISPPAEPRHIYFIRNSEGELSRMETQVAPRAYRASSLKDLAALYVEVGSYRNAEGTDPPRAIAFVGGDKVEVVLDENMARRERLTFLLTLTTAMKALRSAASELGGLSQGELIDALRITLCGCVDKAVIQQLRTLKSTKAGSGESKLTQSSKGMSREVLLTASAGGGEVPEEIVVNVPIYEEFVTGDGCRRYPIICALVMNLEEFTFNLIPMSGQLEQAYLAEQQRIAEELRFLVKPTCTVICGLANGG